MKRLLHSAAAVLVSFGVSMLLLHLAENTLRHAIDWSTAASAEAKQPVAVTWKVLRELDYQTGAMTPELTKLVSDGATVRVPGFMVPLEDSADAVQEFFLVPYFMACVHVPPPPPNQMVHVKMTGTKKQKMVWDAPVWVHGQLQVISTAGPNSEAAYILTGVHVEPYEESR